MNIMTTNKPEQLVNVHRLLEMLFDELSRPSVRHVLQLKAQGNIRHHKVGRKLYFLPSEVMEDLTSGPKTQKGGN